MSAPYYLLRALSALALLALAGWLLRASALPSAVAWAAVTGLAFAATVVAALPWWRRTLPAALQRASRLSWEPDTVRLRQALDAAGLGLWEWDPVAQIVRLDARCARLTGDLPQRSYWTLKAWRDRVHPMDRTRVCAHMEACVAGTDMAYDCAYRYRHHDGYWVWVQDRGQVVVRGANGGARRIVGSRADISERKDLEHALETFRFAVEESAECVLMANRHGHIFYANAAAARTLQHTRSALLGMPLRRLQEGLVSDEARADVEAALSARKQWVTDSRLRTANGACLDVELTWNLVGQEDEPFTTLFFRDVTALRRRQAEVAHIAFHDALTGLPNRRLMQDRLEQALGRAVRQNLLVGVCYLDLDGFKPVNDAHGHEAGDRLLIEVARRLEGAVRAQDTVARLGGDEFVVLLTDLRVPKEGVAAVERIRAALVPPCVLAEGVGVAIRTSLGLAFAPTHGRDAAALLRAADRAMYRAKSRGRNQICISEEACLP